ncbi:MAG: hypothetical protein LAP38_09905 [Acidobacteriia bacterium]|nr:hypothetical protein [Terriglobia bacterium]
MPLSLSVLAFVVSWILPAPLAAQATQGAAEANKKTKAKPWAPPLTPDGKPDLQGNWMNRSATPLERPKQLEGRQFLSDAEVKQMQKRSDQLFNDGRSDYLDSGSLFEAVLAKADVYKDPTGPLEGNDVTLRLEFDNRTSLIVDPPDGKLPPYTPAGKQRREARDALEGRDQDRDSHRRVRAAGYQGHPGFGSSRAGRIGASRPRENE